MPRKVTFQVDADTKGAQKGLSGFGSLLQGLEGQLRNFGGPGNALADVLGKMGTKGTAAALGIGVAGIAIGEAARLAEGAIQQYTELGDKVLKYSQVTGISAEESSRQIQAFQELGVDGDTAAQAMFRLGKNVETAAPKLAALGVEVAHAVDGSVDLNATLLNVIEAYQSTGDVARRDAIIFQAFGRGAAGLLPVLNANAAQLERLEKNVATIYTAKDLKQIRDYEVGEKELKQATDDLGLSIGRVLLPVQLAFIESVNKANYIARQMNDQMPSYSNGVQQYGHASGQAAKRLGDQYDAAKRAQSELDTLAESALRVAQANEDLAKSVKDATDAVWAGVDASEKYRQALLDFKDADKAARDAKYGDMQLNIRATEATEKLVQAAGELAVQQKGVAGTTEEAGVRTDAQIAELQRLEGTVKKGSPLWNELQAWIDKLNSIPREVYTDVHLSQQTITSRSAGGHGQLMDDGGTVQGPPGAIVPVLARGGEHFGGYPPKSGRGGGEVHIHIHDAIFLDNGPSIDRLTLAVAQRLRMVTGI